MTKHETAGSGRGGATSGSGAVPALCRLHILMSNWHRRTRERRELLRVPDDVLKDIGVSEADAYREARKPFWRA